MRFKLQENAIISHHINSFCLVCECSLDSEALALQHIDQNEHQQNLQCFPYLEKYKDDRIRMVKMGYFCEYCTKFISTPSEINTHVSNTNHCDKKFNEPWQRVNGAVVAFNKVIVDDTAWHSVYGNKCFICNTVFENEGKHKSEDSHLIKLVQTKVDLHEEGIYRKLDNEMFQCLTCNIVIAGDKMEEHFKWGEHKMLYTECQKIDENIDKVLKTIKETADWNISEMHSDLKAEKASNAYKLKNDFESIATYSNIDEVIRFGDEDANVLFFDKNNDGMKSVECGGDKKSANVTQIDNMALNATPIEAESTFASNAKFQNEQMFSSHKKEDTQTNDTFQKETIGAPNATSFQNDHKSKAVNENITDFEDTTIKAKSFHNNNVDYLFNFNIYDGQSAEHDFTGLKQDSQIPSLICDTDDSNIFEVDKLYMHAKSIFTGRDDIEPDDTIESFATRHELVMTKQRDTRVTCLLCTVKVLYSMPEIQQHVFTRKHRTKTAQMAQYDVSLYASQIVPAREIIPFRMAAVDFVWRTHFTRGYSDVILNNTYRLSFDSYHLYYFVQDMQRVCHVCDNKVPFKDMGDHNESGVHQIMMNLSLIVTELRDEFVREILPNKYHCGFCNLVLSSFRDLKDHMRGRSHRDMKLAAYRRLHQVLPQVGQMEAISSIIQGNTFVPNWAGRNNPGVY